jgi:hypothetical protein
MPSYYTRKTSDQPFCVFHTVSVTARIPSHLISHLVCIETATTTKTTSVIITVHSFQ